MSLELELQEVVSFFVRVLGVEPESLQEQYVFPTTKPSLQPYGQYIKRTSAQLGSDP